MQRVGTFSLVKMRFVYENVPTKIIEKKKQEQQKDKTIFGFKYHHNFIYAFECGKKRIMQLNNSLGMHCNQYVQGKFVYFV